jgi:hypothetical protein
LTIISKNDGFQFSLLRFFDINLELRYKIMKPSIALEQHRETIRQLVTRYRTVNPRVFGSAIKGADKENSDLDLLVDTLPGVTLLVSF